MAKEPCAWAPASKNFTTHRVVDGESLGIGLDRLPDILAAFREQTAKTVNAFV